MKQSVSSAAPERLKTILLMVVIAALALTLAPMLAIARYNVPYGDDLLFSSTVGAVFHETGSVFAAVDEAVNVFLRYYQSWQGSYAAILLMALQPGVFGAEYYALTPFLMIGALLLSTLLFARTATACLLHADRKTCLICAFLILLLSIQFPPSAREAFYWYNGAVYYTFFHCLFLCLLSVLIRLRKATLPGSLAVYGVLGVVLAGILAGGNYATALPAGIFLFLNVLLWALPETNGNRERRSRVVGLIFSVLMLAVFCAGMLISVSAPGNAVRQAAVNETYQSMSAPMAIALSFPLALAAILNRLDIGAVLLTGLLLLLLPPYIAKSKFTFPYPGLAILLAFCIYASQFTPTLYAAGSPGPFRLRNLEFFNFYWLLSFDVIYLTGTVIRRRERAAMPRYGEGCREQSLLWLARRPFVAVLIAACLVGGMFLQRDLLQTPVYVATAELLNGTAAAHAEKRRHALLPQTTQAEVPVAEAYPDSKLLS